MEDWHLDSTNVYVIEGREVVRSAWGAAREKPPCPKTHRSVWMGDRKKTADELIFFERENEEK